MADIVATVQIIVKGQKEIVKMKGSARELSEQLKQLAKGAPGAGKEQFKAMRLQLEKAVEAAAKLKRTISTVNLSATGGVGTGKDPTSKGTVGFQKDLRNQARASARKAIAQIKAITRIQTRALRAIIKSGGRIQANAARNTLKVIQRVERFKRGQILRAARQGRKVGSATVAGFKQIVANEKVAMSEAIKKVKTEQTKSTKFQKELRNLKNQEREMKIKEIRKRLREEERAAKASARGGGGRRGGGERGGLSKFLLGSKGTFGSAAAGIGFAGLEISQQIKDVFEQTRLDNVVGPLFSRAFGIIGTLFGQTMSQIFADLGDALGQISEAFINTFTGIGRIIVSGLSGIFKGLSRVLVASIVGGLAFSLPGALFAAFVVGLSAVADVFQQLSKEITAIISNLFRAISSIIAAGLRIAVSIIKGFVNLSVSLFKSLFEGIKGVMTAIRTVVIITAKSLFQFSKVAVQEFSKVESAAARMKSELIDIPEATEASFAALINTIRSKFGQTLADTSEAVFDAVSSGFRSIGETIKVVESSARLAIAAESTLKDSTNTLITVIQNFDDGIGNIEDRVSSLTAATTLARATLQEFGPALKNVAGTARVVGLEFDDLLSIMAVLTRRFGRGSAENIGRFLNRMLEAIALPASAARKQFEDLGITIGSTGNAFEDVFSTLKKISKVDIERIREFFPTVQSRKAILALSKSVEELKGLRAEMQRLKKFSEAQFSVVFKTFEISAARVGQSIKGVVDIIGGLIVGGLLSEPIRDIADAFTGLFEALAKSKDVGKITEGIKKAFAPLREELFGPIVGFIKDISKEVKSGGLKNLFDNEKIKTFANGMAAIVASLKQVPMFLLNAFNTAKDAVMTVKGVLMKIKDTVTNLFSAKSFAGLLTIFETIKIEVKFIRDTFLSIFDEDNLGPVIDALFQVFADVFSRLSTVFIGIFKLAIPIIGQLFAVTIGAKLKEAIIPPVINVLNTLSKAAKLIELPDLAKDALKLNRDTKTSIDIGLINLEQLQKELFKLKKARNREDTEESRKKVQEKRVEIKVLRFQLNRKQLSLLGAGGIAELGIDPVGEKIIIASLKASSLITQEANEAVKKQGIKLGNSIDALTENLRQSKGDRREEERVAGNELAALIKSLPIEVSKLIKSQTTGAPIDVFIGIREAILRGNFKAEVTREKALKKLEEIRKARAEALKPRKGLSLAQRSRLPSRPGGEDTGLIKDIKTELTKRGDLNKLTRRIDSGFDSLGITDAKFKTVDFATASKKDRKIIVDRNLANFRNLASALIKQDKVNTPLFLSLIQLAREQKEKLEEANNIAKKAEAAAAAMFAKNFRVLNQQLILSQKLLGPDRAQDLKKGITRERLAESGRLLGGAGQRGEFAPGITDKIRRQNILGKGAASTQQSDVIEQASKFVDQQATALLNINDAVEQRIGRLENKLKRKGRLGRRDTRKLTRLRAFDQLIDRQILRFEEFNETGEGGERLSKGLRKIAKRGSRLGILSDISGRGGPTFQKQFGLAETAKKEKVRKEKEAEAKRKVEEIKRKIQEGKEKKQELIEKENNANLKSIVINTGPLKEKKFDPEAINRAMREALKLATLKANLIREFNDVAAP